MLTGVFRPRSLRHRVLLVRAGISISVPGVLRGVSAPLGRYPRTVVASIGSSQASVISASIIGQDPGTNYRMGIAGERTNGDAGLKLVASCRSRIHFVILSLTIGVQVIRRARCGSWSYVLALQFLSTSKPELR